MVVKIVSKVVGLSNQSEMEVKVTRRGSINRFIYKQSSLAVGP